MAWMLQGKKTENYMGAKGCKTSLNSKIEVIGLSGAVSPTGFPSDESSTIPTWTDIERPQEIKWEVETVSDRKGASDKFEIELQVFDMVYVSSITDAAMNTMTEDQIQLAIDDPDAFVELLIPLVENTLNPALTLKTVYSTQITTDANGLAEGVIPILPQFPEGIYTLMFHYGYSEGTEKADSKKMKDFWVHEMVPLVIEVTFAIIASAASGGLALAAFAIAAAAATYDISRMASDYQENRFGIVGENVHGCDFPYGGFIHTYSISFELEEQAENLASIFSQSDNTELLVAVNQYLATQDLIKVVIGGTLAMGVLLILGYKMKQRRKK